MFDQKDLICLYQDYNMIYFDNCLPPAADVQLEFSNRLTASAGICYPGKRIIRLSTHYHQKFPEEVGPTLLHEMIHLLVRKHGVEFRRWVEHIRSLGGKVEIHARERAVKPVYRWYYDCTCCGCRYKRKKRMKNHGSSYRCGLCGGGLTESKY